MLKTFESVRVDKTAQATCVDGAWSEAGIAFRLSSATCGSFKLAPRLLWQVRCDKDPYHVCNLFRCLERSPEHGFIWWCHLIKTDQNFPLHLDTNQINKKWRERVTDLLFKNQQKHERIPHTQQNSATLPLKKNTDDWWSWSPFFFPKTQKMTMEECLAPVIEEAVGVGVSQLTRRNLNDPKRLFAEKKPKKVTPSCREGAAVFSDLVATEKLHHRFFFVVVFQSCMYFFVGWFFLCTPFFFPNFCVGSICRDSDVWELRRWWFLVLQFAERA